MGRTMRFKLGSIEFWLSGVQDANHFDPGWLVSIHALAQRDSLAGDQGIKSCRDTPQGEIFDPDNSLVNPVGHFTRRFWHARGDFSPGKKARRL